MNTTITSPSYLLSRDQYQSFRTVFKKRASNSQLTPVDILIHNIIRALPHQRGFSPITNPNKLANGADPWWALKQAKTTFLWTNNRYPNTIKKMFDGNISDEQLETIAAMITC